jgi:diguanylate cyclase (GGDEF)-like protein
MTRKSKRQVSSGRTILLVDDDPEYLGATRLLLEREGHQVLCAADGVEALNLLHQQQDVELLLLDYYMPGMTGEEVVAQLRQFNPYVQVILQTGYASEQPPRELLQRLDIQGYYEKSEGPEKLLLWVDVGLKSAYTLQLLNKSRQGLRFILDVTPDLHKIQPLEELLQGILWQVSGLLGVVNSFLAVLPSGGTRRPEIGMSTEGFLAILEEDTGLIIRASTGRFIGQSKVDTCLDAEKIRVVRLALQIGEVQHIADSVVVPLRVGQLTLGVVFLDRSVNQERNMELLHIFANQAAVAIQNAQLYEMATLDPLTGLFVRRFFEQCLLRELRSAFRSRQPLSLLMVDIDDMKSINDTAGHLVGDQALSTMGRALREATRSNDIVGRYGGDEFILVLPQTSMEGAEVVGRRILEGLKVKTIVGPNGPFQLMSSIGVSELKPPTLPSEGMPLPVPHAYFQAAAQALIKLADDSLYQSKHSGGNQLHQGPFLEWSSIPVETVEAETPTDQR